MIVLLQADQGNGGWHERLKWKKTKKINPTPILILDKGPTDLYIYKLDIYSGSQVFLDSKF